MDLSLKLTPERRLVMTFALRQALEILQMPQMELGQWLRSEIERNPLLELSEQRSKPRFDAEIPATITLHEHLLQQIRENFTTQQDRKIAEQFLEYLDERGFLSYEPVVDARILSVLQTFDPPGIFARNLQEVLLLQLKANSLPYKIVQDCFDDLLHGRYATIKKKLGDADLGPVMQILARLSFRPASAFQHEPTTNVTPDLLIEKIEGGWTLELIEDELPKFHMRDEYLNLDLESRQENELLQGLKTEAKWVFRSLSRRRKLLREIGRILLRKQAAYLDQKGPLDQFTVKELAEKLQIHESTLSRALSGKYASTPRGIIPLRSLLSASPATQSAKELLQTLVLNEDKAHPLTDDQLSKALNKQGLKTARRTIAKYRNQLKIGPAARRKNN